MLLFAVSSLIGCKVQKESDMAYFEGVVEEEEDIIWNEIDKNGIDEELLIKNIDKETLNYIAQQLQNLCTEIGNRGEKDENYWLRGQWYSDATDSEQYKSVLSLGKAAMKPLFLILYQSKSSGMYEWICSKALEEISAYDFSQENNGAGWSDSKEFLELFIRKANATIENKQMEGQE